MTDTRQESPDGARLRGLMIFAWLWVSVPFAYGLYELILKAKNLFST